MLFLVLAFQIAYGCSGSIPGEPPGDTVENTGYTEIPAFGKVINFSEASRPGKISIFILTAWWCGPCKKLLRNLDNANLDPQIIDLYKVNMSFDGVKEREYEDVKATDAFKIWKGIEGFGEWPTCYIVGPTRNIIKWFSPSTLKRQDSAAMFDEIMRITSVLTGNLNVQFSDVVRGMEIAGKVTPSNQGVRIVNAANSREKDSLLLAQKSVLRHQQETIDSLLVKVGELQNDIAGMKKNTGNTKTVKASEITLTDIRVDVKKSQVFVGYNVSGAAGEDPDHEIRATVNVIAENTNTDNYEVHLTRKEMSLQNELVIPVRAFSDQVRYRIEIRLTDAETGSPMDDISCEGTTKKGKFL
jgi:thiol-disulfide isomerase/thioredoxin